MVQHPNLVIEVCGEGQPDQIRDLKPGGRGIYVPKSENHQRHQHPQQDQPAKSKTKGICVKEDETPEEIDDQLGNKQIQRRYTLLQSFIEFSSSIS